MANQLKVNCEVRGRRVEEQSPLHPGFEYEILFPGTDRLEGYASVNFRNLGRYIHERVYDDWRGKFSDTDLVAEVATFYPHSMAAMEDTCEHMRQGVGTFVLERMIEDSKAEAAKIMHGFTNRTAMMNFLLKNGFTRCDDTGYFYRELQH